MRHRDFRARRRLAGVSQTVLAEMLGTHQGTISAIECYGPRNERECELAREIDGLLPSLPAPEQRNPTDAEIAAIRAWLDKRIEESEPGSVRQYVALEARSRLRS